MTANRTNHLKEPPEVADLHERRLGSEPTQLFKEKPVSHPTPRDVVTRYLDVLYNQRRLDLIPELIADPTWRHHAGEVKDLAMAETIERLEATLELCPELHFDVALMHEGGDMVTVAWNGRSTQVNGKSYVYCGIEIFRVANGKIIEIWNSRETGGHWAPPVTIN